MHHLAGSWYILAKKAFFFSTGHSTKCHTNINFWEQFSSLMSDEILMSHSPFGRHGRVQPFRTQISPRVLVFWPEMPEAASRDQE